jgi:hypothetical protein
VGLGPPSSILHARSRSPARRHTIRRPSSHEWASSSWAPCSWVVPGAGDRFFSDPDGNGWILEERPGRVTVEGPAAGRGEHVCRRRLHVPGCRGLGPGPRGACVPGPFEWRCALSRVQVRHLTRAPTTERASSARGAHQVVRADVRPDRTGVAGVEMAPRTAPHEHGDHPGNKGRPGCRCPSGSPT